MGVIRQVHCSRQSFISTATDATGMPYHGDFVESSAMCDLITASGSANRLRTYLAYPRSLQNVDRTRKQNDVASLVLVALSCLGQIAE
jgi:hypothetical protein